ncbi:MAG: response regulator [Pseudomonadales bacterium]|nr:response regulator [Pseudomonadales bacterium]
MNRLLRGKQTIPFTIGFAGLGMGLLMELWMGAASPSAVLLAPIGIALLVLSLGVLIATALAYRADYLRHASEAQWFIDQPHAQQEGYLLLDRELRIHAMNERARQWMGETKAEGMSLEAAGDAQAGWSALERQLSEASNGEKLSGKRLTMLAAQEFPLRRIVCGIPVALVARVLPVSRADGAVLLNLKPVALGSEQGTQPSPLEFYGLLMESSLSAKIVIDDKGAVVDYNPAAQELLGFTRAEIVGEKMSEHIVPKRLRQAHNDAFAHFLASGEGNVISRRVELEALHKSGYELPVELTINALDTQHGIYFGAEIRDLRKWRSLERDMREAREESDQANQSKSRFLATMSHEIRTPLNALLGILNLVKAGEQDAQQRSLLSTAENAGERLMRLLTNLLDYSKIEAGEMSNDSSPFSPASVIDEVMALFQSNNAAADIELCAEMNGLEDLWVLGDSQKVMQVLTNLLSNAMKFTDSGQIKITLQADSAGQSNPCYRVKVRDTGIGMSQTQLNKIFDAFVQVDDSDRRKYLGTGLGLSICQQLTQLMGGELMVESTPKLGSEFTLSLPMQIVVEPESRRIGMDRQASQSSSRRILVVEDSKPNQLVVQSMLERRGYAVDVANDGIAACAAMKKKGQGSAAYGLVLMDVQMPGMDGIEATRWIRNNGFKQPIIALTAKAFAEDERACLDAGMNDFMTKPINYEALTSRVDMWLGVNNDEALEPSDKVEEMRMLMGDEALNQALSAFLQETDERRHKLERTLAANDLARAAAELHALCGTYRTYGFEELGHLCRALEESCNAKLLPQDDAVARLSSLATQVKTTLTTYREQLSA